MTDRTLVLLRHAKAEPPTAARSDADRPLSARGRADAAAAGHWLADQGLYPDLVLCSPARRTRETWSAVRAGLGSGDAEPDPPVSYVPSMYAAGVDDLLSLVGDMPDEITTLLVIGHNPTISVCSAMLDSNHGGDIGLRTAGLAVHAVSGGWTRCGRGGADLVRSHTARAERSR